MLHCYMKRLLIQQRVRQNWQLSSVSCLTKEGPGISTYLTTLVVKIKGNGQKEKTEHR